MRPVLRAGRIYTGHVVKSTLTALPVGLVLTYAVVTLFNLVAFNQGDLNHTVGSSYAYLNGHALDFYDYNKQYFGLNDYYPTVYVVFAAWMAPVKLLISPGVQNGVLISSWEVGWGKVLLLILFLATVHVLSLIARELFPANVSTRRLVCIAYALSPFAAFAFDVIGQYDVLGVLFTLLGILYYLRGDKWRFALFFALGISCKYFALAVFVPLLLLRFKKIRDVALLGAVAVSVVGLEAAIYSGNYAFRHYTLFGLAGQHVADGSHQAPVSFVIILFGVGCLWLWRTRPSSDSLGMITVYSAALAYGLVFEAVSWNPQWFMILAPLFALCAGYLRRPVRFLVWESVVFLSYLWVVVNRWPANVDSTMTKLGALRSIIGPPKLLLSSFYPGSAVWLMQLVVAVYVISPLAFLAIESASSRNNTIGEHNPGGRTWWLRLATVPVLFTLPTLLAVWVPTSLATRIDSAAPTREMSPQVVCPATDSVRSGVRDGVELEQTFSARPGRLAALSLLVGTYGRTLRGNLHLSLHSAGGDAIAETDVDLDRVADNSRVYLMLPNPLPVSAPTTYTIDVGTAGVLGDGVAFWGSASSCMTPGVLSTNGTPVAGDLNLTLYYTAAGIR